MTGLLSGVRILELAEPMGIYTGKLLADLGADVIKVEPPGGSPERRMRPFFKGSGDSEESLVHFYHNANKRSVTLDLDKAEGIEIFYRLLETADAVIETFPTAKVESGPLNPQKLLERAPGKIILSITPFGRTGPYRYYASTDLVNMAMGGLLYLAGHPDSSPVRAYGNQSYMIASLHAAVALLMALYSGSSKGEYIDVSIQEAVAHTLENAAQYYDLEKVVRKRNGNYQPEAGSGLYPAKDGYVYILTTMRGKMLCWDQFVRWLSDENAEGAERLKEDVWQDYAYRIRPEAIETFNGIAASFFRKYDKLTLYETGQKYGVSICPLNTMTDLLDNPQLKARDFFRPIYHDDLDKTVIYPGPPYRFSGAAVGASRRPPKPGEHNAAIYEGELRIARDQLARYAKEGVI